MKNQKGFSAVAIVLFIVVIGLVCGVGYFVWNKNQNINNPTSNSEITNYDEQYYPTRESNIEEIKGWGDVGMNQITVPSEIIDKSYSIMISYFGKDFYDKNIMLSPYQYDFYMDDFKNCDSSSVNCKGMPRIKEQYYKLFYLMNIPEKPYVSEIMEIYVDKNGNLIKEAENKGLINCVKTLSECIFKIDASQAGAIAKNAGMQNGVDKWQATFNWSNNTSVPKTYVWEVMNFLLEGGGQVYYIRPSDGKILLKNVYGEM